MINSIVGGITAALKTACPGYDVYTEGLEKDLPPPCFFVQLVRSEIQQVRTAMYFRKNLFAVHFLPGTEGGREAINAVIEQLNQGLEYITVDGNDLRGSGMKAEISGGALVFNVNYDLSVYKLPQGLENMEELLIEGSAADG